MGLFSPWVVKSMAPVVAALTHLELDTIGQSLLKGSGPLSAAVMTAAAVAVLVLVIALLRLILLSGRKVESTVTWDCGYAQPSARMQYTASSFAEPLTTVLASLLRTRQSVLPPEGPLPSRGAFASETPDAWRKGLFEPVFGGVRWALSKIRWLQHGRVQLYVFYIALTILVLLAWKL
jgi:hypothetical protein